ncbi:hypothetical protein [Clostridium cellulovorans]|uniref:Uncharacterized protein n=1 Tax=Clostridium cellulovorans (strain ATCC 35296 / DSM 3052 / OCM 3 / 743B) TaxID=573061 RepID=D9SKX9_CLOC7|nr:hypothetical protein [Clostridium cellulovorans]ADL53551.1 hypothetical protein Clocel_3885 [Clostridium cellulovorans 743B]
MKRLVLLFTLVILSFSPMHTTLAKELHSYSCIVHKNEASSTINYINEEMKCSDAFLKVIIEETKAFKILEENTKKNSLIYHLMPWRP